MLASSFMTARAAALGSSPNPAIAASFAPTALSRVHRFNRAASVASDSDLVSQFLAASRVAPTSQIASVNSLTPANGMCEDAPNQGAADERRAEATAAGYEPDTVGFAAGRNLFRSAFFDLPIWAVAVTGARPCTASSDLLRRRRVEHPAMDAK